MDLSWVSPALVGAGVIFQLWREAKRSGGREARLEAAEARLNSHSGQIRDVRIDIADHGERIAHLEGLVCSDVHGGD